jgi:hypothetical protein
MENSRCKKGTRRNKKTNLCEPVDKQKSPQQEKISSPNKKKSPLKRCQKGTRRNKKTNLCESVDKISSKQTQSKDELKNRKRIDKLKQYIVFESKYITSLTDRMHFIINEYNNAVKTKNVILTKSFLKKIESIRISISYRRIIINEYRDELQQLELLLPINKINLDKPQELLIVINSHGSTIIDENDTPHILDIPPSLVERNNEGEIVGKVFYRLTTSTGYHNISGDENAKYITQEIKSEFMKNPVFLPFFSKCKVKETTFCLVGEEKKCFNEGKICIPRLSNSKYIEKRFTPSSDSVTKSITFIFKNGDTYHLFNESGVEKFIKKYFNTSSSESLSVFQDVKRYYLSDIFKILKELNDNNLISNVYIYDNSCGTFSKNGKHFKDKVEIKKMNANIKLLDDGNLLYGGSLE